MAEFCGNCVLRGKCSGKIDNWFFGYVEYESRAVMGHGPLLSKYNGQVGVFADEFGNPSEPLFFPSNRTPEQMIGMIANCDSPITEERGIIRKRLYVVGCSALGGFAITQPDLINYVKTSII
ncbi:MAG TPA: hypothetical protein VJJ78_01025 [Candidatus Saccharimonadales bacterium]|nr:hypothetical protein [Candidatus Saccharimonadales bacterium]